MKVCLLVITDGRRNLLRQTMDAWIENWDGPTPSMVVVNDSADESYTTWLDTMFPYAERVHHDGRRGFGGAIQSGWDHVGDADWVFHLEDDFVIRRPVPFNAMARVLAGHPYLAQLALKRQPWNEQEKAAGGIVERWPHEYAEECDLYPALNRVLGGADPTAPMSRAHAEISVQIARLGRLIDDIGDRPPDEADITDLRATLYGLYAILRLHTAQEDETYLSLGDMADTSSPAGAGRMIRLCV